MGAGLGRCRRYQRAGGGGLLLCETHTRCYKSEGEGPGEERPSELAGMPRAAYHRRIAGLALGDRAGLDDWMSPTN